MDLKKFEPLFREQGRLTENLYRETSDLPNKDPDKWHEITVSILDGSIDPGDFEDMTKRALKLLYSTQVFKEYLDFYKNFSEDLAKFYSSLRSEDCEGFMKLQQRIIVERLVKDFFKQLLAAGYVVDKTGKEFVTTETPQEEMVTETDLEIDEELLREIDEALREMYD